MDETTRLVADDAYEEMGAAYQCVQIALLDEALIQNGVEDAAIREKICGHFIFSLGNFHDQCWFKPASQAMRPLLCFAEPGGVGGESLGTVYAPSSMFSFHEYAFGCVGAYFEGDPAARVEVGTLDQDGVA